MTLTPARSRHGAGCECHACLAPASLEAATPNSELALEQPGRLDPTGTTTIQRELARFLRGRVADLHSAVRELVVDKDAFGLATAGGRWAGLPQSMQVLEFVSWLEDTADARVMTPVASERVRRFLERAAERGIRDGHQDLQAFDVATDNVDEVLEQDAVQEQIDERHQALRDRVATAVGDYQTDAQGIATAGLGTGVRVGRVQLATDIGERASVYQSHVTSQASGEVVNQYNTTQLTSYDRVDAEVELDVDVEYVDAGDDKVCQRCLTLSGQDWTLERAQEENPIPMHDSCRCRFSVTDVRKVF